MDLQMPEMKGHEALVAICHEFADARILVVTTNDGDVQALRAIKAGAAGYLLKNMLRNDLPCAIRAVHAGPLCIPNELARAIAEHSVDDPLTQREMEVLRSVAAGNANKEVAGQLSIAEETVKARMSSILSKLGAKDRTHAVMIVVKRVHAGHSPHAARPGAPDHERLTARQDRKAIAGDVAAALRAGIKHATNDTPPNTT